MTKEVQNKNILEIHRHTLTHTHTYNPSHTTHTHLDHIKKKEHDRGRVEGHIEDGHDRAFVARKEAAEEKERENDRTPAQR